MSIPSRSQDRQAVSDRPGPGLSSRGMPALQPGLRDPLASRAPAALDLRVAALTDLGRTRDHQEDAAGDFAPPDGDTQARKGRLLVVADGMGGHLAGEVASQMALAEISRAYFDHPGDDVAASLVEAVRSANQIIYRHAQAHAKQQGMGTTAAVAVVRGHEVQVANVGDSRVYLLRDGTINQITEDHSWVEAQVRAGVLTSEQAQNHPQRNLITRALGKQAKVEPDLFSGDLRAGDVLLLCSDGLTAHVSDGEILQAAGVTGRAQDLARLLVDLANQRGGSDNISVIVAKAQAESPASPALPPAAPQAEARSWPLLNRRLLAGILFLIAASVVVAGILLRKPSAEPRVEPVVAQGQVQGTVAVSGDPTGVEPTVTLAPVAAPLSGQVTQPLLPAPSNLALQAAGGVGAASQGVFSWQWSGTLSADQAFEVRIWRDPSDPHLGAAAPQAQWAGDRWTQTIDVGLAPAVSQGGEGTYRWTVAVVQVSPYQRIGQEPTPQLLMYAAAPQAAPQQDNTRRLPALPTLPPLRP